MANVSHLAPGLDLEPVDREMISTNAVSKGDVVALTSTVTSSGRFTTVVQPTTAQLESGIFGVALEDIAAGETGTIRFRGYVQALITGTPAALARVAANNTSDSLGVTGAAEKAIGIMTETGTNGNLHLVLFDGLAGFGTDVA